MYPALAVLKALQVDKEKRRDSDDFPANTEQQDSAHEFLWVGGEGGIEVDLLSREEVHFTTILAAGVHGVGLKALPGNLWKLFKGFTSAWRIIKEFQPQVLFFTGGYIAVPVALAGRLRWHRQGRPKIAVYVPDIEPGLALKLTARLADQIMLTVEDSMEFFENRSNLVVTGYPTRLSFEKSKHGEALAKFSLSPDLLTLLVFGGSKGARSINQALISILPDILSSIQVIHISGQLDWSQTERAEKRLPVDLRARYRAYPYLHNEMGDALQAADIAVSRAGASVLGEFPLFSLPAILIPYPHAWRYQEVNAHYLEARGAALVMQDHDLEVHLLATIKKLMEDKKMRDEMSQAMSSLATPHAAESIAKMLQDLVTVPSSGRI